jgi:hypothetical protein
MNLTHRIGRKTYLFSASLDHAVASIASQAWRTADRHGSDAIRHVAARSLLILLAAGYSPTDIKRRATAVYGGWTDGHQVPEESMIARLSVREELHSSLLDDLAKAATETQRMRIGAEVKSARLVEYARAIRPISPEDANVVFNNAVQAASELDREVMTQIRLLNALSGQGAGAFTDARTTGRNISDVIADAAIRLDGDDYFPWEDAMHALVILDAPLALANAARWDDEAICSLESSLPPLLKKAVEHGSMSAAQCSSLSLLIDGDEGVTEAIFKHALAKRSPNNSAIAEDVSYDLLIRKHWRGHEAVLKLIDLGKFDGHWTGALRRQNRFISTFDSRLSDNGDNFGPEVSKRSPLESHVWDRDTLLNPEKLRIVSKRLLAQARESGANLTFSEVLLSAISAVAPRDRVAYLSSIAALDEHAFTSEAMKSLLHATEVWWDSPAVKNWCRVSLPDVVVKHLPMFWYSLQYRKDDLTPALERTNLAAIERQKLILRGIELHVDNFTSESVFALAARIGRELAAEEAAGLASWYAERLIKRIPLAERDQTSPNGDLPNDTDEAVARFLFAYMGDFDVRKRWRAAHGVRRLARADEKSVLARFIDQYPRIEDSAFRGRDFDFYWLAARLWFVIAWDRVSTECPDIAAAAGQTLLRIALDDNFPHVLVRSFARDACEKLVAGNFLPLSEAQRTALNKVNETQIPRLPISEETIRHFSHKDENRRVEFDPMDTLPYWYQPQLNAFADVDANKFLEVIEHWIIDVWGYNGDIRRFDNEPRRNRLRHNWPLSSNRQGSMPTLERLNNHLEWHAMWCAVGELLKTKALRLSDDDEWDSFTSRVKREKLSEPPLWSADLICPAPLVQSNFRLDERSASEWILQVEEAHHRGEFLCTDRPDYVVVDAHSERRMKDRIEAISVSSALVTPETAGALVRALQVMEDPWDYKLPEEDENAEFLEPPYCLVGWLKCRGGDIHIDEKDPLRLYASAIRSLPGEKVTLACSLTRDKYGRPLWFRSPTAPPMFIYEVWGDHEQENERHSSGPEVAGRRLLAHKQQLQEFLSKQDFDLIIEVGVTRRERKNREYDSEETTEDAESRFNRLYRLRTDGALEVAEGHIGTWSSDRSTVET